jgi:hypothetical protein
MQTSVSNRMHQARPHDHTVHVYADDLALTRELVRFISSGLTLGERVVVVTGPGRRAAVAAQLTHGPLRARASESLVLLDTVDTLDKLMAGGVPNVALFEAMVGRILDEAVHRGQALRVFGDMVATLWGNGNVTGAMELESLWNSLAGSRQFFLMCAYPASSLHRSSLLDIDAMRDQHSGCWLLGHSTEYAELAAVPSADGSQLLVPILMPDAIDLAVHFTVRTLTEWHATELINDAEVVISELAGNALNHSRTAFRVTMSRTLSAVRIAVEDSAPMDASTARVLARVDARAARCGFSPTAGGKSVWADLARSARRLTT